MIESIKSLFNNLIEYFTGHPQMTLGLILIVTGIVILTGAILNWQWLFEYNKIDKMNDRNFINFYWFQETFGRKASRILMGGVGGIIILCGIISIWLQTGL